MKSTRVLVFFAALLCACGTAVQAGVGAPAPVGEKVAPAWELVAIDMFGTRQVSLEQLLAAKGAALRAYAEGVIREDPSVTPDSVGELLQDLGDFAVVEPSLVGYHEAGKTKYYLTVDLVDPWDAERRMPFVATPSGQYADPEGLLADWHAYEQRVAQLMGSGRMNPRRQECPAFHCLGDSSDPVVKPFVDRFASLVPRHIDQLMAILRDDHDARHRSSAAYLLAYMKDGPTLVRVMVGAFRDPDALVRNNAMRVVADIAHHHAELEVPIEPVLEALDYPSTSDRNKASAILVGLLERPSSGPWKSTVRRRSGEILLRMLELQQPNNHDFAYRSLELISGKSYGERDYAAWAAWLAGPVD